MNVELVIHSVYSKLWVPFNYSDLKITKKSFSPQQGRLELQPSFRKHALLEKLVHPIEADKGSLSCIIKKLIHNES